MNKTRTIAERVAALIFSILALFATATECRAALPELKRGISLSSWFANAPRQPLVDRDFKVIRDSGFDYVRIPVNPELFGFSLLEAAQGRILWDYSPVDQAVGLAVSNGLAVVLDIHPGPGLIDILENNSRGEEGFIQMWLKVAQHYRIYAENVIAFEVLDGPPYIDRYRQYNELAEALVTELREVIPNHLMIIDAPNRNSVDDLQKLKIIGDPNVVYAFQFYEPPIIAYQGWNLAPFDRAIRFFRKLPYPSRLANVGGNYAPDASDAEEAKRALREYVAQGWDASHIAQRIKIAADWAAANKVRVMCSEFGAMRVSADPASRYRWITDTRKALESRGITWASWDYADLFGIVKLTGKTRTEPNDGSITLVDPENGERDIEPDALKALLSTK